MKAHSKGRAGYSEEGCDIVEVGRSVLYPNIIQDGRLQGWC